MRRLIVTFIMVVGFCACVVAASDLVIGSLALVERSENVPYAYWYYVPESAVTGEVTGLVWHATPGGSTPDDPTFWARFDLGTFLACNDKVGPRVNLPERNNLILFSIAVPEPSFSFYEQHPDEPLGTPVALSSLLAFREAIIDPQFLDPDLKALASIEHLKLQLDAAGIPYDPRLFITGVYGGAEWAHRFALLHPGEVRAVAPVCGNWYTMPYDRLNGATLPWPLGLARFEELGRGPFDQAAFSEIPYYVTASSRELVWYSEMTPEEQGIDPSALSLYVSLFGTIPPERGSSFALAWKSAGYPFELAWSEGGHGWIDPVRVRVFEFFAEFELNATP